MPPWVRRHPAYTVLLTLLALAAIVAALWALQKFLDVDANIVAAAAAALAAIYAARSASTSSHTARDAARALSWATKPTLGVRPIIHATEQAFEIQNTGLTPVGKISARWTLRDGSTGSTADLGPLHVHISSDAREPRHRINVHVPELSGPGTDQLTIDYWGIQGTTGWRQIHEWVYQGEVTRNGIVSTRSATHRVSETEIS